MRATIAAALLSLTLAATAAAALSKTAELTRHGLGRITVGLTEAQVEARLGHPIALHTFPGSDCGTATLEGRKTYGLFTAGVLRRVTVRARRHPTQAGVRVGDAQETITEHYPTAKRSPAAYDPNGYFFKVTKGKRRLVFTTDGEVVTEISGGRIPEVDYIEGCA